MNLWVLLLAACGIAYFIQYKATFLRKKHKLLDELVTCPYCCGFHGGWFVYLMVNIIKPPTSWMELYSFMMGMLFFGFAASITNFLLDSLSWYLDDKDEDDPSEV